MKNILVVDDNKIITDMVKLLLESSGYRCSVANDAGRCLKLVRTNKFDLILLDVVMPNTNGIEIMQKLKSGGNGHNIVFFTARPFVNGEREKLLKEPGVRDCLDKPICTRKLLEVVERCAN